MTFRKLKRSIETFRDSLSSPTSPKSDEMKPTDRASLLFQILKEEQTLTNAEVVEVAGLTPEQGIQLWRNLGFPDPGDEAVFGKSDAKAAAIVGSTINNGIMDERTVFRLTRALGQTMAKLADWE